MNTTETINLEEESKQKQPQRQQQNPQHYSGTILTTKAKNSNASHQASSHQIKAISKESVEALMRTAAKI